MRKKVLFALSPNYIIIRLQRETSTQTHSKEIRQLNYNIFKNITPNSQQKKQPKNVVAFFDNYGIMYKQNHSQ